ncbi:MAG TPA: FliH/SctL family protein [Gemmataceae bacterium]|nr:FliH/SctL family protein [Gemmataceae bacterium]
MLEHDSPRVFEIRFRSPPRLRDIVHASLHIPLPAIPRPEPAPTLTTPDLAQIAREERAMIEQVLAQLRIAVDKLGTRYDAMTAEMRQAVVELALAVAGRLVFDKLQAGEFPIEEMMRQAIARLPAAPAVTVYLHPDDLALLRQRLMDQPLLPAREPQVRIEADAGLNRGGCRAEAGEIHVLTDLAGELAELRQHLLWSASHARSGPGPSAP